jgi:hypothetical protein
MKKNTLRTVWWAVVFFYVVSIYATLGIAPAMIDGLNALIGGRIGLVFYAVYFAIAAAFLLYAIFVRKERSALRYLVLALALVGFFALVRYARFSSEKTHMAEYGLLGILLYNALKIDLDRFDTRLYACALVICAAVGAVDEAIQAILPNRYFDWRDIFMNAASGALVLLVIRVNILRKR